MLSRIAHVSCDPGVRAGATKGAAVHLAAMRRAFTDLGLDVDPVDERSDLAARARLEAAHTERPYGAVYERFALRADAVGDFARAAGVPHVLEVNAPLDEEESRHRPGAGQTPDLAAMRRTLAGADLVLAVSTAVAEWAVSRGARPARVAVEPNGVDTELFSPALRAQGRARLGLTELDFVVGFHGRLRPWHRLDRIAAAVRALRAAGVPARLVALGHGDFEGVLAASLPAEAWRHVAWLPHEEVGPVVAAFDALPLGYDVDQPCYFSPLKLREAMAAGVVPVVPALGDLPREVGYGAAGVVVAPGDDDALGAALMTLARRPERRAALAASAARAAAAHTWRGIAERVLARVGGAA